MLYVQGGSIIEVKGDKKGGWKMVTDSKYARRITGINRHSQLTGPANGSKAMASGTTMYKVHLLTVLAVKHYGTQFFLQKKTMKILVKQLI